MGKIAEKPALLHWLYRQEFERPLQIRDVVAEGAKHALGKSVLDAEAYSEANAMTFWRYLLSRQLERSERGLCSPFEILDEDAKTLCWYGVGARSVRSQQQLRRHSRLRHRPAMLRMIDALDDREYEALGCVIVNLGGGSHVFLTPSGNEGGVDFFARVALSGSCHLFRGGLHPLRIVGQCKKYSTPVGENQIKEFVETIQTVKYRGESKIEKLVPAWFHATRGPVIGLMFSHSGFQSGADTKGRNHGILFADTLDLAEIAALSKKLPHSSDGRVRADECRSRVTKLLSTPEIIPSTV
jgi:hypothetical protein